MIKFVLDPGGNNEVTITESEIISHTPRKTHTGMGVLRAQLATTKDLLPYAKRKDRINVVVSGSTEFTGLLVKPGKRQSDSVTSIKAFGIAKKLEESRPDYANEPDNNIKITQTALDTAIRNYWPRTPFSASVTDQSTDIVEQGATLASLSTTTEFESLFSFAANEPFVISNGDLFVAQSAFVREAENAAGPFSGGTVSRSDFSDGSGLVVTDQAGTGNVVIDFDVSPQYDIDNAIFAARGQETGDSIAYDVNVSGSTVASLGPDGTTSWDKTSTFSVPSGTSRITLEPNYFESSSSQDEFDVVAILDDQFSYNLDNTDLSTVGRSHLNGPELYPDAAQAVSDFKKNKYNIKQATVDVTIDDTTGNQALGLNYDSNNSFDTASKTTSHTYTNPGVSRQVRTRLTLGRYPPSGTNPQSATPRFGYKGQTVSSLDLTADLNDRVVVDELTLTGNHLENLQQLHEYGNFQWTIEHSDASIGNLSVISYQEGDETRSTPAAYSTPIEKESSVDSTNYYNALYLRGKQRSDGSYPTAEVSDSDEINDIGERIDTALTDPTVTTDAGAEFRALALLDELSDENNRRGKITIPLRSSLTHPGYARSIDFGNGAKLKTIEEVRLSESTDGVEQTHIFTPPDNVADEIEQLRRDARKQRG